MFFHGSTGEWDPDTNPGREEDSVTTAIKTVCGVAWPADLIEELRLMPMSLSSVTRGASNDQLDRPSEYSPCAREILAHLRDSEFMVMRLRVERILAEDVPVLAPFDEEAWAATRWRGRDSLSNLLEDFQVQRRASIDILERLTEAQWMRETKQIEIGVFDLLWWVEHWASRDREHLAQLHRLLPH